MGSDEDPVILMCAWHDEEDEYCANNAMIRKGRRVPEKHIDGFQFTLGVVLPGAK